MGRIRAFTASRRFPVVVLLVVLALAVSLCAYGLVGLRTADGPGGRVSCEPPGTSCTVVLDRRVGGAAAQVNGSRVRLVAVEGDVVVLDWTTLHGLVTRTLRIQAGDYGFVWPFDHPPRIDIVEVTADRVVMETEGSQDP